MRTSKVMPVISFSNAFSMSFSISLLRLDDEMKALLDAPADTPAWR